MLLRKKKKSGLSPPPLGILEKTVQRPVVMVTMVPRAGGRFLVVGEVTMVTMVPILAAGPKQFRPPARRCGRYRNSDFRWGFEKDYDSTGPVGLATRRPGTRLEQPGARLDHERVVSWSERSAA